MSEEYQKLKERLLNRSEWNGECLESTYQAKSPSGYALIKFRKSPIGAHRASWIAHNGEIPKGLWVLHTCDNPLCIRIDHLFLGTPKDNTDDMIKKKRNNFHGNRKHSPEFVSKAVEMRKNGMTYKNIAKELGISIGNLNLFFQRPSFKEDTKSFYGVPKYSQEVRDKAIELRNQGIKCKEIQKILGIPKRSLSRIFNTK